LEATMKPDNWDKLDISAKMAIIEEFQKEETGR
jgi:hypothetical protein